MAIIQPFRLDYGKASYKGQVRSSIQRSIYQEFYTRRTDKSVMICIVYLYYTIQIFQGRYIPDLYQV